jgi:L-amino acid N-acyltransferase YncA
LTSFAPCLIRDAVSEDFAEITQIYAHHVRTGTGSFEETPPDVEEMIARFRRVRDQGLPYRVAEIGDALVGYAYASPFRPRSAYRFTIEDSIYVDERYANRGIGRTLLQSVIADCAELGYRQMIAVIGDSANEGSLRLHTRAGFRTIGHQQGVGYKFGRWLDIVLMQFDMNGGTATPPGADPIGWKRPS